MIGIGRLWDCATVCLCYTAGCTAVKVATEYEVIYVFVCPKTRHTFFFNTSLSLYRMNVLYYFENPLAFLPSIISYQYSPSTRRSGPKPAISPKLRSHLGRRPSPCTFWHSWFSQMKRMTDMFCWLQRVWLLVVASALTQATIRLLLVTKCLSCLATVNHKFLITHSASYWTSNPVHLELGASHWGQLNMSCCMPWDFITSRVQQIETTMWQSTGRT